MLWEAFNGFKTILKTCISLPTSIPVPFPAKTQINIHKLGGGGGALGKRVRGGEREREDRMAARAAETMLRYVFDGCLSMQDTEIERRPYHRNCSCAMHKLKGASSGACSHQRKISFPEKHPRTQSSLASKSSSGSFRRKEVMNYCQT